MDCPTGTEEGGTLPRDTAALRPPSQIELQDAVEDGLLSPQVARAILDLARASEFIKLYDVAHPLRRRLLDAALLIDDQVRALREAARYEPLSESDIEDAVSDAIGSWQGSQIEQIMADIKAGVGWPLYARVTEGEG